MYLELVFIYSIPWHLDGSKWSIYHNIFLSQYCVWKCLVCNGPSALFTHNIFAHNIAIKRYCDKKDVFGPWMSIGQGKLLSKHNTRYIRLLTRFYKSLPWLFIRNLLLKMSNVAISFYRNIVCENVWCVTALR